MLSSIDLNLTIMYLGHRGHIFHKSFGATWSWLHSLTIATLYSFTVVHLLHQGLLPVMWEKQCLVSCTQCTIHRAGCRERKLWKMLSHFHGTSLVNAPKNANSMASWYVNRAPRMWRTPFWCFWHWLAFLEWTHWTLLLTWLEYTQRLCANTASVNRIF